MWRAKTNARPGSPLWRAILLAVALVAVASCGRADDADETKAAPAARPVAEPAGRLPFTVATSGQNGPGLVLPEPEELQAQDPEGHSARRRALGEGHEPADDPIDVGLANDDDNRSARGRRNDGREDPPKEDDDDDEKDYWRDVTFTRANFDQVRRFVREHYIDGDIDEKRAYIEAASFALLSMKPQPLQLLPVSFHGLRKGHPEEEGALDGATRKLRPRDGYLLHEVPKEDEEPRRRRMSDYAIRQLRLQSRARHALLERHWAKVPFGEADFTALIKEALRVKAPEMRPSDVYVAAAQGYLYSLDPHSSLVSAKAWEESTRETEDASFDGIGAVLTQRDNQTVVESPIIGQPALRAGLRAGDVILRVDQTNITGWPLFKVVKHIRGPGGTQVTLTIRRMGLDSDIDITITRAHIDIKNVAGRLLDEPYRDVGYIKLTGFVRTSAAKFDEKVAELTAQTSGGQLRGLVFDLRNDNGGLLSQGIAVADRFLPEGIIVSVRNRSEGAGLLGPRDEVYRATPDVLTIHCPVVVLVNDGTASAAEIVASALQENRRGVVLGDRTFGKASVQTLYPPPGQRDYYIKLTVARYYSPSGRTLQLTGVRPDVAIPPEVGGDMPLGFREEDLRNPLTREDGHYVSPWSRELPELQTCVGSEGKAEKLHAADPNPAIKFDYQLMKAADYLQCLIDGTAPSRSAKTNAK